MIDPETIKSVRENLMKDLRARIVGMNVLVDSGKWVDAWEQACHASELLTELTWYLAMSETLSICDRAIIRAAREIKRPAPGGEP